MPEQTFSFIPSEPIKVMPSLVSVTSSMKWFSASESTSTFDDLGTGRSDVLYMYIDESGNLDFGPNGSRFFILTCMVARRPFDLAAGMTSLKHDCMEGKGFTGEKFHACEDMDAVRQEVVGLMSSGSGVAAYSVYIEKEAVDPAFRTANHLYSSAFESIVSEVYEHEGGNARLVIVITDLLPQDAKRSQVVKPLKKFMKEFFNNGGVPYMLLHLPSCSDMNLQAADYLCWAYQRMVGQGKDWPFKRLAHLFKEHGEVRVETESGDA